MTPAPTGDVNFGPLYNLGENSFWPTLSRRQPIPAALASSPNAVVGLGMVKALTALVSHLNGVAFEAGSGQQPRWQVWLTSSSSPIAHALGGDPARWQVKYRSGYLVAVAGALDALCAYRFSSHPSHGLSEVAAFYLRWQELLAALRAVLSSPPLYSQQQLLHAAADAPTTQAMMAATDALYAVMQVRKGQGVVAEEAEASGGLTPSVMDRVWLYTTTTASGAVQAPPPVVTTGLVKTLSRVIRRGRTALLVGPTGAGKTEAVKQAALDVGATLVKIEGHPGLDDKLLFGGVYPNGQGGFAYVEGPLSEAWRYAAEGQQVVLQLDELARMDKLLSRPAHWGAGHALRRGDHRPPEAGSGGDNRALSH